MFPETYGRTLEELTFIFEDKALADRAVVAVEKVIHHEDMSVVPASEPEKTGRAAQAEQVEEVERAPSKV